MVLVFLRSAEATAGQDAIGWYRRCSGRFLLGFFLQADLNYFVYGVHEMVPDVEIQR